MHISFVTKYRRRVLKRALRILRHDFERVCHVLRVALIEVNGEEDHVHLLVQYLPTLQLSQLVGPFERLVLSTSAQGALAGSRVKVMGRTPLESKLLCSLLRRRADRSSDISNTSGELTRPRRARFSARKRIINNAGF